MKPLIHLVLAAVLCLSVASPALAEGADRRGTATDRDGIMDMNGNNGYGTTRMQTNNNDGINDFNLFNDNNNRRNMRTGNGVRASAADTNAGNNDGWGWLGLLGLIGLAGLFNRNRARS